MLKGSVQQRCLGLGFTVREGRVRWDIKKEFLALRVVRPKEAVAAPSLEMPKAGLDGTWSNLA